MKKGKVVITDSFDDLYVKIFLVGYEEEGESCIFVLGCTKPENKILYSMVIDSCEYKGKNNTLEILRKLNPNRKLDLAVWTHPHDDHTIGFDKIIKEFCGKRTRILVPEVLNNPSFYSKECIAFATFLSDLSKGKAPENRPDIIPITYPTDTIQEIEFDTINRYVDKMVVRCISPYGNIGYSQCSLKDLDINKMSIAIVVELYLKKRCMNFLFAGDIENQTIRAILIDQEDDEIPNEYNYIKIPHHGSNGSDLLVKMLSTECNSMVGCTSIYINQDLPKDEAIQKLKTRIDKIYCTAGNKTGDTYGVIRSKFNIIDDKTCKHIFKPYGTATEI